MKKKLTKGMITLTLAISIGMIIVGGITTFYTVKGNTDKELSVIRTGVALNENNIEHLNETIKEIKTGQDLLLDYFKVSRQ